MTLPKKYRRNIVVDDHKFHWHFHPYRFGVHSSFICVQDASGTGPLLKIQWVGIALPNHVESAIRFAWETGWDPQGKQILEIGVNSLKEPVTFCIKPADASRHWFYDDFYNRAVREAHIVDPAQPDREIDKRLACDTECSEQFPDSSRGSGISSIT